MLEMLPLLVMMHNLQPEGFFTHALIKICSLVFQTDRPLIILGLAADETVQKFVNSVLF